MTDAAQRRRFRRWRHRRNCMADGCSAVSEDTYCPAHRTGDRRRATDAELHRRILSARPRCAHCGRAATEVDHITPVRDGGTDHPANLQPLCAGCHRAKSAWQNRAPL